MKRKRLTSDVKARIPAEMKRALDRIAEDRLLTPSDLVREAIANLVRKSKPLKEAA